MAGGKIRIWLMLMVVLAIANHAMAQKSKSIRPHGASINDTIILGVVIDGRDTMPAIFLPEFIVTAKFSEKYLAQVKKDEILRQNIYRVYPYAVVAGALFKEINKNLETLHGGERRRYLKTTEKKLDAVFKKPLKDLSIDQGHVLVKLINRQSGQNCYSIIRELKNGISAMVWSGVGSLFGNNLNHDYDPKNDEEDAKIEKITSDLEVANYNQYMYQQQQARIRDVQKQAGVQNNAAH